MGAEMQRRQWLVGLLALALAAASGSARAAAQEKYGAPGTPIKLEVGYQPYYTESWSGVVINGLQLWKKYLPPGSEVEFQVGLQGAVIVGQLLADKQQIGYMGDMPALVATNRSDVADIRLVAVLGTSEQQCNIFLVRSDAPVFETPAEFLKWLDGKVVASPHGSCTDRFAQAVFRKNGIKPAEYLNQNIEVISTNFKVKKLDAAVIWEPTASKLVAEGTARRVASGVDFHEGDAGFLGMRHDLIEQRPDVVRAWLEAELDAQIFLADPRNADAVAKMAEAQTTGMSKKTLWMSLYGDYPRNAGGDAIKESLPFIFSPAALQLAQNAHQFLFEMKRVSTGPIRTGAIDDAIARQVLADRHMESPVGVVKALPESDYRE
jgi:NitT/TauT family transport system substrate-binding protein